jgi:hypothetical protein
VLKYVAAVALLLSSSLSFAQTTTFKNLAVTQTLALPNASVTASMLASGAAAANLSTRLPGLSASVQSSGVPGLDQPNVGWYLYRKPASWVNTPALWIEDDTSLVTPPGANWFGSTPYTSLYVHTQPSRGGASMAGLQDWYDNSLYAGVAADSTATAGIIVKKPWHYLYTGASSSGTGTSATITFTGSDTLAPYGQTIPVGHTVWVQNWTPSAYNGHWKVTASSAGSVTFASTATGAMTTAGSVMDVDVGNSFGGNFNCTDETGAIDPVTSCIGTEIDVQNSSNTTDANRQRVILQLEAATGHVGRGILFGTKGTGGTIDRAVDYSGANIGIGEDFSGGTFSGPALALGASQSIAFDTNSSTGAFTRYLSQTSGTLTYTTPSGSAFSVTDNGTVKVASGYSGPGSINVFAPAASSLYLGYNGATQWGITTGSSGGLAPNTDNAYNLGLAANRVATGYFVNLGASGTPITNGYITTLAASTVQPSSGNLNLYSGSGSSVALGRNGANDWLVAGGASGDFQPNTDNSRNVGGASNRVKALYAVSVGASATPVTTAYVTNTITTANPPTISSCGTSPPGASGASNSASGRFTLGTGATAACTVTFATAYPSNAFCTVTPASAYTGTYYISAQSASAFTVTLGTGTASVIFQYSCAGN